MHHQNDSTWVKSRLWTTTEHLPGIASLSSLLTMDSPLLDTTRTHHLLYITLQQITEPIISGFFF